MNNEMRDKLKQIIRNIAIDSIDGKSPSDKIADALIEAGVILPKFNKFNKVWFIDVYNRKILNGTIQNFKYFSGGNYFLYKIKCGEYCHADELKDEFIFPTESEAQQAIKDMK